MLPTIDQTLDDLVLARALISRPALWTRYKMHGGGVFDGVPVRTHCASGAVECAITGEVAFGSFLEIAKAWRHRFAVDRLSVASDALWDYVHRVDVVTLNDNNSLGHAEVLEVFDLAIATARAEILGVPPPTVQRRRMPAPVPATQEELAQGAPVSLESIFASLEAASVDGPHLVAR